jgi:Protein of unknown function (DUF3617)
MRRNLIILSLIATTIPAGLALADDISFPARKAGEWQIKMTPETAGAVPAMTMQLCLDAATDAEMMQTGLSVKKDICPEMNMTRDGDTIVIDAKCNLGVMKTTSHTVISGDFQSAYTMNITSDIEGAPKGMPAHSEMTQEATWVGECPAGMVPGDMIMPGGRKINVKTLKAMMGGKG